MFVKRFICALLISCTLTMSVSSPYYEAREVVKAAEVAGGSLAWEIMLYILMSLGITVEASGALAPDPIQQERAAAQAEVDYYLWLAAQQIMNGNNNQDEDPKEKKQLRAVLDMGDNIAQTGQGGELVVPQDLWNSLREWSRTQIYEKDILPEIEANDSYMLSFNAVESAYSSFYYPHYRILLEDRGKLYYYWFDAPVAFHVMENQKINNVVQVGKYSYQALFAETNARYMFYNDSISGRFRPVPVGTFQEWNEKAFMTDNQSLFSGSILWSNYNVKVTYAENVLTGNDRDMTYRLIDTDGIGNAIANGDYDVVTAGRTYNGSEMSGDVTINIPDANTASQIVGGIMTGSQAQEELGVIPVNVAENKPLVNPAPETNPAPDIDESINNANKNQQQKQLKNVGAKIATLFPFCIPFDIKDSFKAMIAVQKAPVFETDIEFPSMNFSYHIKIDMSEFETQVLIFRWGMILLFCVGLMLSTYQLIKWHDGGD